MRAVFLMREIVEKLNTYEPRLKHKKKKKIVVPLILLTKQCQVTNVKCFLNTVYNEVNRINLLFIFSSYFKRKTEIHKVPHNKKHLFLFKSSELFAQSFFFHTTNVPLTKRVDF